MMTSGAWIISKRDISPLNEERPLEITSLSPINAMLTSSGNSARASFAPSKFASGAKSPPRTSIPIFIQKTKVQIILLLPSQLLPSLCSKVSLHASKHGGKDVAVQL